MIAGARVEVAPYKRDPMDFVLWKPSKPGEPAWPSPWSNGRPGWHIECSAMSGALLGDTFDIHGGGIDLIFPHHENEIAQSRCAHGTSVMANYWMHNGFLQVEGEKMSKSLGNFVTIHELLNDVQGQAIRFNMLKTHYRQPIDWRADALKESVDELWSWAVALQQTPAQMDAYQRAARKAPPTPGPELVAALNDDLNTPAAITVLRRLYSEARSGDAKAAAALMEGCEFLGVLRHDRLGVFMADALGKGRGLPLGDLINDARKMRVYFANGLDRELELLKADLATQGFEARISREGFVEFEAVSGSAAERSKQVENLLDDRKAARAAKDFARADEIRKQLDAMGIALKDAKDPKTGELVTTWEVKR
jgi:cysteinyl-tRNA synthetase